MGKSSETFSKKEKEKKRLKKQQDKKEKAAERKANSDKGKSLDDMMAYVDENGNITDTAPDLSRRKSVRLEKQFLELSISVEQSVAHFGRCKIRYNMNREEKLVVVEISAISDR